MAARMSANNDALDLIDVPALAADGVVLAPIAGRGAWGALGALRGAMRDLRRRGLSPDVSYVFAVSGEGRIVSAREAEAAVLVMGYRLTSES